MPIDHLPPATRRAFLRHTGALSLLAGAGAPLALNLLAAGQAAAQTASDYKALVCVFLFGGNDAFNTVLATDTPSWAAYTATRGQGGDGIALAAPGTPVDPGAAPGSAARLGGVLPLQPDPAAAAALVGRSLALHPQLGALQGLFNNDRRLAVLANIGPLWVPTTKAQLDQRGHPRPPRLYSHNDQQTTWQALAPEGATRGWGGRMAELLLGGGAGGGSVFTAISAAGNAVWLAGDQLRQYQVGQGGPIRLGADAGGRVYGSTAVAAALQRIATGTRSTHLLEADVAQVAQRAIDAEATLRNALRPAGELPFGTAPGSGNYSAGSDPLLRHLNPLTGAMAANPLAQQLQIVARLVDAGRRGATGVRRQVFFVSLGGFDTHDNQHRQHALLMSRLDHGLAYFDATLGALGAREQVTAFTASDFGRTFTSNGDGTDHGWGGHHFVMGGAVRGGRVAGRLPQLGTKNASDNRFDSSPDQLANGSLLPTTAVESLGATLGAWFGLSAGALADVFPRLSAFDPGQRDLGLLRG